MTRRILLLGVALLYGISIPWYREPGGSLSIVFGLPDWVAVALGCYVGAAILNCLAWLFTEVPDGDPEPPAGAVVKPMAGPGAKPVAGPSAKPVAGPGAGSIADPAGKGAP